METCTWNNQRTHLRVFSRFSLPRSSLPTENTAVRHPPREKWLRCERKLYLRASLAPSWGLLSPETGARIVVCCSPSLLSGRVDVDKTSPLSRRTIAPTAFTRLHGSGWPAWPARGLLLPRPSCRRHAAGACGRLADEARFAGGGCARGRAPRRSSMVNVPPS